MPPVILVGIVLNGKQNISHYKPFQYSYIFSLWSFINNKLVGLKLPSKHDGESDEEYEDRCINVLIKALEGFKYDGHPVTAVHVPSNTNEVEIGGEKYANNFFKEDEAAKVQDIMDDDKMTREKLRSHEPTVAEYLKIIFHHMQTTAHGYVIRKCKPGEYSCEYCKSHPTRGSTRLWSALPSKKSGGLFYDCQEDVNKPGHYRTLLDLLNEKDLKIKPDGIFPEMEKCQEKNCFTTFKSRKDGERHSRLAHNIVQVQTEFPCNFKVNGKTCGQVFESAYFLQKHKNLTGHKVCRKKKS